jgi:hypothetical protein
MDGTSDTPLIGAKIKELQSQVDRYNVGKTKSKGSPFSFKFNSKTLYIAIPVVILILLLLARPGFIKSKKVDDDGNETSAFSFKKFLIAWLVISGLLVVGLFGFNYKSQSSK